MSEVGWRLWRLRLLWEDEDFSAEEALPYQGFQEDLSFVEEVAEGAAGERADRFFANQLLSGYHMARKEYERAVECLHAALPDAERHWQAALCHRDIFACLYALREGEPDEEQLDHYESFALECFLGIRTGEEQAIHMAQEKDGAAEKMGDHALLAVAAQAWSLSEQNGNVMDQVEAMERYDRELQAFLEEEPQLLESPWGQRRKNFLAEMEGRRNGENPINRGQRQLYRALRVAADKLTGTEPGQGACFSEWDEAGQEGRQAAEELAREGERFREKYPAPKSNVLSIPMEGLEEYIALARRYIRQLQEGNAFVMRDVWKEPKLFTDMWDYLIPTAACLLWAAHPSNRDPAERRRAGEQGRYWLDIFFGVMVGVNGRPHLFEKWKKRGLKEHGERQREWLGLLKDTLQRLRERDGRFAEGGG